MIEGIYSDSMSSLKEIYEIENLFAAYGNALDANCYGGCPKPSEQNEE